jgi:hypothetical protein
MIEAQLIEHPLSPDETDRVSGLIAVPPQSFACQQGFILWALPDEGSPDAAE